MTRKLIRECVALSTLVPDQVQSVPVHSVSALIKCSALSIAERTIYEASNSLQAPRVWGIGQRSEKDWCDIISHVLLSNATAGS